MATHCDEKKGMVTWTRDSPVTKQFVRLFYGIMNTYPEHLHQFYGDGSKVIVSEFGPSSRPLTKSADNRQTIRDLFKALYKDVKVAVKTAIPQISVEEGVLLMVSGTFKRTSSSSQVEEEHYFTQALMLAPQKRGYYVLTDTLHIMTGSDGSTVVPFSWTEEQADTEQSCSFYPVIKTCPSKPSVSKTTKAEETIVSGRENCEATFEDEIIPDSAKPSPKGTTESNSGTDTEEETKKISKVQMTNVAITTTTTTTAPQAATTTTTTPTAAQHTRKFQPNHPKMTTAGRLTGPLGGNRIPGSYPMRVGVVVPPGQAVKPRPPVNTNDARMMPVSQSQGVFVARLPFGIQPEEVVKAFSIFGPILNGADGIQVRDGRNGCYAFVTFESAASAEAAVQNGAMVQGKRAFVERRHQPQESTEQNYSHLSVGMPPACVMPHLRLPTVPTMVPCDRRRAN